MPAVPIPQAIDPEIELQRKILDIMSKPSITTTNATPASSSSNSNSTTSYIPVATALEALKSVTAAGSTTAAPSAGGSALTSSAAAPQSTLLADPKVQKALDSLLSGSLFNF